MKRLKLIALAAASFFTITTSLTVQAQNSFSVNQIVVFGDSFSDNGNLYYLSNERTRGLSAVPQDPYYQGRFSNNLVWPDYFRDKNKIVMSNFAYGGAEASPVDPNDTSMQSVPYLAKQVNQYLDTLNQAINEKTLFPISIGANDYLEILARCDKTTSISSIKEEINQEVKSVMDSLTAATQQLVAKGGKHFAFFNLPNFQRAPALNPNSNIADSIETDCPDITGLSAYVTKQHNQALSILLPKLRLDFAISGIDVTFTPVDLEGMLDGVMDGVINRDPAILDIFGVSSNEASSIDIENACYTGTIFGYKKDRRLKPCSDHEQYVFWDSIHPTTQVHEYFSDSLTAQLQQEGFVLESQINKTQELSIKSLEKFDAQLRFSKK